MKKELLNLLFILMIFVFGILMLNTIKQYFTFSTTVGFLAFKQKVVQNIFWRISFYIHIFSITLCLFAGITQFSNHLLTQYPQIHNVIGKIYVYNIVFVNFPACLILALFSNGGILGVLGFLIQDFLWIYYTISAVYYIKQKQVIKHKRAMILSYAITTTALTFRIVKKIIYKESAYNYELFYGINVWFSLIINMLIAIFLNKRYYRTIDVSLSNT